MTKNKKYLKIIVPTVGISQNDKGLFKFNIEKESFSYEIPGDPYEFTFKAIKKLFLDGVCSEFILVGGEVEMIKDEKKLKFIGKEGKTIPKAEVMRRRLVNDYGIPAENLICLTSASNTTGNALEILRYFTEKNVTDLNEIGLLTRFYHIPRSVKIFKESANLSLVPICTESIVYDEEFELIKDFYSKEGLLEIIGDIKNSDSEIKGMGDQEKGSYVPRFK